MVKKEQILKIAKEKDKVKTSDLAKILGVSRQHVSLILRGLVDEKKLVKFGSTRGSFYTTPEKAKKQEGLSIFRFHKELENKNLEEHIVLNEIHNNFSPLSKLTESVHSIFHYAFSEMLNNAIEHSESKKININVSLEKDQLIFHVDDFGIGAFKNIMKKRGLNSELEAIQDLLKGKTTTQPKSHSGEGIFFTSKVCDRFTLESFDQKLVIDNKIDDVFLDKLKRQKKGTKITFSISTNSKLHLNDVFKKYANIDDESDFGFDRTEIKIKLYTIGGIYISRSQARRVLAGLEKFKSIILDFNQVPVVGQAFADEIFRVFQKKHPAIKITPINMEEGVKFMIDRSAQIK